MRGASVVAATLVVAAACSDPSSAGIPLPIGGEWGYHASQRTPAIAAVDGSLTLHGVAGDGAFEGTFVGDEQTAAGGLRRLDGTAAGRLLNDSIADFDLVLGGVARRHVGIVRGDSISGSWATQGVTPMASGDFVARRPASEGAR
jgi:hypothetical protein